MAGLLRSAPLFSAARHALVIEPFDTIYGASNIDACGKFQV
jgi:hypothetical protein